MERNGRQAVMDNRAGSDDRAVDAPRIRPLLLLAVWTAPALLSCIQRWLSSALTNQPSSFWRIAAAEWPGWYLWAALTPAIFRVAARFPFKRPHRARDVLAHAGAWSVCLLLHAIVTSAVSRSFDASTFGVPFPRYVGLAAVSWLPSTFLLYVATVGVALWMRSVQREQRRAAEGAALSVQLARAELNALRSQLHPHFLFNTLNTIAILIRERETHVSARLVTQLGDVLRHVLRGSRTNQTSLDDEIALVRTYLEIEQVRFGERLRVDWTVQHDVLGAEVPALVLQPLVENALRYGIAPRTACGVVEIGAQREGDDLVLWIADNGPGTVAHPAAEVASSAAAGGVGLTNTRERLVRLYPGRSSLQLLSNPGGGTRAEVRLPLRTWVKP
jgi:two-component system, LytTR family, sensor kinase